MERRIDAGGVEAGRAGIGRPVAISAAFAVLSFHVYVVIAAGGLRAAFTGA